MVIDEVDRHMGDAMKVIVRSSGVQISPTLGRQVRRQFEYMLARFQTGIGRVTVHFSELTDERGQRRTRCQVRVDLRALGLVVIDETDVDLLALVNRAEHRVMDCVVDNFDRAQRWHARPALRVPAVGGS